MRWRFLWLVLTALRSTLQSCVTVRSTPRIVTRRGLCTAGLCYAYGPWPSHAAADIEVFTFEEKSLGLDLKQLGDGRVGIERVKPGSPALAKGLPPLSVILQVNQRSAAGLSVDEVTNLIRWSQRPLTLRIDASAYRTLTASRQTEAAANALGMRMETIQLELLTGPQDPACSFRSRTGDLVEVEFTARVATSGREFDSSVRRSGRPFAFMLGNGDVVRGLELGTLEMCIGEERLVRVPPLLGFGSRGSKAYGVPPDSPLEYHIRLVSINMQSDPKVRRAALDDEQRFSEDEAGIITNAGVLDDTIR